MKERPDKRNVRQRKTQIMPTGQPKAVAQGIVLLTMMMTTNMRRIRHKLIMPHANIVMAVALFMLLICMEMCWLIIMAIRKLQHVGIVEVVDG